MSMQMIQIQEPPTCGSCGNFIDEDRDQIGVCLDCEVEARHNELVQEEFADYAARRSQYSYLVHESVMKANEIVIDLNGDWHLRK